MNGEQRVLVRLVAHRRPALLALGEPLERRLAIPRVDDEQVVGRRDAIRDQVVDDAAALVREQRVLRLAVADPIEIVRQRALEHGVRGRPLDVQLPHVRDIEDAPAVSHSQVLGDHAFVLDGHLPAGERHQPRAERDVASVERRAPELLCDTRRLGHERDSSARGRSDEC